jgi:hypothetical protein
MNIICANLHFSFLCKLSLKENHPQELSTTIFAGENNVGIHRRGIHNHGGTEILKNSVFILKKVC